jgi:hypothetical protein
MQALDALKRRFQSSSLGMPTDDEAQWFLRDRSFDVEEAYAKLRTCLAWRRNFGLEHVTYQRIEREAATGKAYLHEHNDIFGRPALVVRVNRCAP